MIVLAMLALTTIAYLLFSLMLIGAAIVTLVTITSLIFFFFVAIVVVWLLHAIATIAEDSQASLEVRSQVCSQTCSPEPLAKTRQRDLADRERRELINWLETGGKYGQMYLDSERLAD
jgi:hypothetical protein